MSAFVVCEEHIHALLYAAIHFDRYHGRDRMEKADKIGQMLLNENCRSVAARYRGADDSYFGRYQYRKPVKVPTIIGALKAIDCLEYQSCEHDGWNESEAKRFLEDLRKTLISTLPGYEDAPWAIS